MVSDKKRLIKEFLLMTFATVMISVGVYCFKFPNNFSMGGVSGLSILLGKVLPVLSASSYNTIINVLFLILGFIMLDKGFGFRTVYCSLLSAGLIQVFSWVWPLTEPLTDQLKKYTGLDVGTALLISDVAIAAAALFVFDATAGLCSLLGLALKSVLVDSAIESLNRRKAFFVITSDPEHVCDYVTHTLVRGATVWTAQGAYTHDIHHVVLTVLSRGQAVALRRHLKEVDPHAFMIVANSSEIFGKGFLRA